MNQNQPFHHHRIPGYWSNIQMLDESCTSFHPDFRSIRHHGYLYLLLVKCWALTLEPSFAQFRKLATCGRWDHSRHVSLQHVARFPSQSHSLPCEQSDTHDARSEATSPPFRSLPRTTYVHRMLFLQFRIKPVSSTFSMFAYF